MDTKQQGVKHDHGKPRPGLLPPKAVLAVADVLAFGAQKYKEDGWRQVRPIRRYLDAALRHVFAYMDGMHNDPESGLPHLAHAVCSLLFLLEQEMNHVEEDEDEEEERS